MLELGGVALALAGVFGVLWFLMARRVRKLEQRLAAADTRNLGLVKSTRDMALRSGMYPRQSPALAPDEPRIIEPPPLPVLTEVLPDSFLLSRKSGYWKPPRFKMEDE